MTGALVAGLTAVAVLLGGCARGPAPAEVALEYGRAVYANDPARIYRLVSAEDRRARDEETFRRQQRPLSAPVLEIVGQLASFITATPVETKIDGARAIVRLSFKLPNANAPEVKTILLDWDVARLDKLAEPERRRIRERLDELHRAGRLPMLEGEETLELVRDDSGWHVFLNWAGGVRLRFAATVPDATRLRVSVDPTQIMVAPGERVRVTVRATNLAQRDLTTKVAHRIEPGPDSRFLALLQCPLFVPATLAPGETKEFVSEYLLLRDVPGRVKQIEVTYEFPLG
ncbi:MAG: cytochrome c oxidase assembly protein [Candidatus Rokubacteria bacterium]|nr:cytochrome c oxidase assembly protein [Candidatus Rokubacteria bacterium]